MNRQLWEALKRAFFVLVKSSIVWTAVVQALIMAFFPYIENYFMKHPSLYGCFVLFFLIFMRIFVISGGLILLQTIIKIKDKMSTNIIILIVLPIFIYSCAIHQKLDPEIYYKRDMSIKFEDLKREGTLVLPLRDKYELELKSQGKLDLFTFTTCHRLHTQEDAGGFWTPREVRYVYKPDPPMESTYACPIQVAGYAETGAHSWGFVDLETKDTVLPAKIKCNGEAYNSNGVTICQSKMGLLQAIEFDVEVVFSPEAQTIEFCKNIKFTTKDNKEFIYEIPRRECVYNFMEKNEPHREHRLTTIGFEQIIIRK